MLDWRRVTENPDEFLQSLKNRGFEKARASDVLKSIDEQAQKRLGLQKNLNSIQEKRNRSSKEVSDLMRSGKKDEAKALIEKAKTFGDDITRLEEELGKVEADLSAILEIIPNIPLPTVPVGKSEKDNPEVLRWGELRKFDFTPLSHDEWGEKSGLLDFERAAKVSGSRFSFLRGGIVQLERALISFMCDTHRNNGYEELSPPYIVSEATMYGCGQFPKFKEDVFKIEGEDKYLIPTAELPLTSFMGGEILHEKDMPYKFVAFSPSFRSEAGSYGKDTKGLIRQHQFLKVELVKYATPETSLDELESMRESAESILQLLKIPYRVVELCTGDLTFGSQKTYDLEVWLPGSSVGEGKKGCFREISSVSNFGDFQSRRLQMRYKSGEFKGTRLVHTLNGSGLAVGRTLVAVIENYQNSDLSLTVPEILQPYMGGLKKIEARR